MKSVQPGILQENALSFSNAVWLAAAIVMVLVPHAERLPYWAPVIVAILIAWRLYIARRGLPAPPTSVLLLLAAAGVASTFLAYGKVLGRDPGIMLLTVMAGLKVLEMRSERDTVVVALLGYFLVLTNFLYTQNIPTALYMLAAVVVTTAALLNISHVSGKKNIFLRLRSASVLLAQSLPLMLVLFLFFPRIQGPLWGLPQDAYSGVSGLSETMSPGSLSQLSLSDAVAFRAEFLGAAPGPKQLYWRGPVMWDYDGRTWYIGRRVQQEPPEMEALEPPLKYAITLEAHNKRWLFALDLPSSSPPNSAFTQDYLILANLPVRNRIRYDVSSSLRYRMGADEDNDQLDRALRLPKGYNPRTHALAESLRRNAKSPAEIVQNALNMFRGQRFFYTLTPPLLGTNAVDEFLFDTRSGFCEHYASSFTYLMRAAGVPARVVTGYQGGEVNPVGGYLVVRQSDAHAWSEVWLGAQGWVRVDPTAAAAPARVESGMAAAVPATDPLPLFERESFSWLRKIRYGWDAGAYMWNQWVLGYNPDRQTRLFTFAGFEAPTWRDMAIALLVTAGAFMFALAAWMLWASRRVRRDPVLAIYGKFCRKLAKHGLARAPYEGPADFFARIAKMRPDLRASARAVVDLYILLRYGACVDGASGAGTSGGKGALREFSRRVAEFKP